MNASIQGTTDPRFAAVRDAFAANFEDGLDQGAAFAVVSDGRLIVDLWGGRADAAGGRPWARDSLVNVWSTTKGVVALAMAMLVERGTLDYEAPVARYWPEFAAGGKGDMTVGCMLSHQGGLVGCDKPMTLDDLYRGKPFVDCLAAMTPLWPPGEECAYHALTYGHLAGELLRRIDGRTIGAFIAEEIAGPLDAAFYLGLPEAEDGRVVDLIAGPGSDDLTKRADERLYSRISYRNPVAHPAMASERAWRAAEIAGGNGQSDALGMARIFGAMDRLLSPDTLAAAAAERFRGKEAAFDLPIAFGAGFMLNLDGLFGPSLRAFGHSGWGGSFAFFNPDAGLGVAYVMNRMLGFGDDIDPRNIRLLNALYGAL
ncbi:MAG: serine hydrolase domain-containing protein [Alphaproteobacteria bacterium]